MRQSDRDLCSTPTHELPRLSQDELLRLVVMCRDGNKESRAKALEAWKILVALDIDRIRGIVRTFRFPGQPHVTVDRQDVDTAVSAAYIRLIGMFPNFKGAVEGQYKAATRKCVIYACMDYCIDEYEHDKKISGSLDEEIRAGDDRELMGRFDIQLGKQELRKLAEQEAAAEEVGAEKERRRLVEEALGKLSENKRKVYEMTRDRRPVAEIAAELDTSHDNVYQLRRRALKRIGEILEENDHL